MNNYKSFKKQLLKDKEIKRVYEAIGSKGKFMKVLKKLPKFKNEDEEREFWNTHSSTDYFDLSKAIRVTFPNLKPTDSKKLKGRYVK